MLDCDFTNGSKGIRLNYHDNKSKLSHYRFGVLQDSRMPNRLGTTPHEAEVTN